MTMQRPVRVWLLVVLALVVVAFAFTGCVNAAALVAAAEKGKRSYSYTVRSIYATVQLCGTGITNGTVVCGDGAMTIKSADTSVPAAE